MNKVLPPLVAMLLLLSGCGNSFEKDIIGKWAYTLSLPMDDADASGDVSVSCVSEFFPNKSVNHDCTIKAAIALKEHKVKIDLEGALRGSGEWSVTKQQLFEKTIDAKIDITKTVVNDQTVTDKAVADELTKDFSSQMLKGETTSYQTTSFDGKKWVFEQEIEKKKVSITATRQ